MNERIIRSLYSGSKMYVFRIRDDGEVFEITTTRDIALGFVDESMELIMVTDF